MSQRYLISGRIETEPVSSRNVTGASRANRHCAAQSLTDDFVKLIRRPGRRVTLALMMRFFDKRIVGLEIAKQLCRLSRQAIVNLHAHGKIGAVNQSAMALFN